MKWTVMLLVWGMIWNSSFALAVESASAPAEAAVIDVGNQYCPVSGEKISGTDFFVHEGKRYGVCCAGCDQAFIQNPEKYTAKMLEKEPELADKLK